MPKTKTTTAPEGAVIANELARTTTSKSQTPDPVHLAIIDSDPLSIQPAEMKARMAVEMQKRKALTDYISANMVEGQDYGRIRIGNAESKQTLFKPGSEKFCSLFGLKPVFRADTETISMLGNKPGLIAFICELVTKSGAIVGEGRGVSDITEKKWTYNNAVKIAEKRAQIDAVLRTGGLSDFFTQDLEDGESEPAQVSSPAPRATTAPANQPAGAPRMSNPDAKLTQPQMSIIFGIMNANGITKEGFEQYLLKNFNVIGIENLTKSRASGIIDMLIKKYGYPKTQGTAQSAQPAPAEDVPTIQMDEEFNAELEAEATK